MIACIDWTLEEQPHCNTYLVRFGGAGAVLPFLFVVRRIWTLTLFPLAENDDNFDDAVPGSICYDGCHLDRFGKSTKWIQMVCTYLMVLVCCRNVYTFEIFSPSMALNLSVSRLVVAFQQLQLSKIPKSKWMQQNEMSIRNAYGDRDIQQWDMSE